MNNSNEIIKKLKMIPHPEGGYFVESFRDKSNAVSLIYYLLKKNQMSHWHRLTKNEILHFYQGDPLDISISCDGKTIKKITLGKNIYNNENMHFVVNANSWFSMKTKGEFSLIGCTVSPAFSYQDFEIAPQNWKPS